MLGGRPRRRFSTGWPDSFKTICVDGSGGATGDADRLESIIGEAGAGGGDVVGCVGC